MTENVLLTVSQSIFENVRLFLVNNNPVGFLHKIFSFVYNNEILLFAIIYAVIFIICVLTLRIAKKMKVKRTSTMYKNYIRIKNNYVLKDNKRNNLFIYEVSNSLLLRNLNVDEFIYSKLADKNSDLWRCFEDMQLNYYMNSRTNERIRNLSPTDADIIKEQRISVEKYRSIEKRLCSELPDPNEKSTFDFVLYSRKPNRMKKTFKITFADLQEIENTFETEASKLFLEKQYNRWINERENN